MEKKKRKEKQKVLETYSANRAAVEYFGLTVPVNKVVSALIPLISCLCSVLKVQEAHE